MGFNYASAMLRPHLDYFRSEYGEILLETAVSNVVLYDEKSDERAKTVKSCLDTVQRKALSSSKEEKENL